MIQGIDGGLLINALRQGREDRYVQDKRDFDMAQAQAAQVKQQQLESVRARATGVGMPQQGQQSGVMGNYAPSNPLQPVSQGSVTGMAQPTRPQADPSAMTEWLVLDPEGASAYQKTVAAMDEATLKKQQAKNDIMGGAARYLAKVPPAQRPAALRRLMPQLVGAGWTEQELAGTELSDEALMGYQAVAIDFDKIMDNDLAERKFRAGDTVAMQPGGGVANVRPTFDAVGNVTGNQASVVIEPYGGMGDQGEPSGSPASPRSKADYDALPAGAQYYDPNGNLRTKGGGVSSGTGNFPG